MTTELMKAPSQSQAVTKLDVPDMAGMMKLSELLAKSNLVPDALKGKHADIYLVLLKGNELGLRPIQSLSNINVIKGKTAESSSLLVALCQQSPECEYFVRVDNEDPKFDLLEATYETKRRGHPRPQRWTFTVQDAGRQGLINKDNWKRMPKEMLRARAKASLARDVYPDVVGGLYTPDEVESFDVPTPAPVHVRVVEPLPVHPDQGSAAPPDGEGAMEILSGGTVSEQDDFDLDALTGG